MFGLAQKATRVMANETDRKGNRPFMLRRADRVSQMPLDRR